MMIKDVEVVILAGGLGTRLKSEVPDLPKCMAVVAGRPFIDYLIQHLLSQGITKFIFAIGYMGDIIERHLKEHWTSLDFLISKEEKPLGTGGAIQLALSNIQSSTFIVVNGDTLYLANLAHLYEQHLAFGSLMTLGLKPMKNFDRYGIVEMDDNHVITEFKEKRYSKIGLINSGTYIIDKEKWSQLSLPEKFSFEKEVLEIQVDLGVIYGYKDDSYFIDIGIPEDYKKANIDLMYLNI